MIHFLFFSFLIPVLTLQYRATPEVTGLGSYPGSYPSIFIGHCSLLQETEYELTKCEELGVVECSMSWPSEIQRDDRRLRSTKGEIQKQEKNGSICVTKNLTIYINI